MNTIKSPRIWTQLQNFGGITVNWTHLILEFGGVMATDDEVLFVGVLGISKRREARGRSLFAWFSFSSSTDILLRSNVFSTFLNCENKLRAFRRRTAKQSGYQPKRGTDNFRCIWILLVRVMAAILKPNVSTVDSLKIAWKTDDNKRPLKVLRQRWSTNFRTKDEPSQLWT